MYDTTLEQNDAGDSDTERSRNWDNDTDYTLAHAHAADSGHREDCEFSFSFSNSLYLNDERQPKECLSLCVSRARCFRNKNIQYERILAGCEYGRVSTTTTTASKWKMLSVVGRCECEYRANISCEMCWTLNSGSRSSRSNVRVRTKCTKMSWSNENCHAYQWSRHQRQRRRHQQEPNGNVSSLFYSRHGGTASSTKHSIVVYSVPLPRSPSVNQETNFNVYSVVIGRTVTIAILTAPQFHPTNSNRIGCIPICETKTNRKTRPNQSSPMNLFGVRNDGNE